MTFSQWLLRSSVRYGLVRLLIWKPAVVFLMWKLSYLSLERSDESTRENREGR